MLPIDLIYTPEDGKLPTITMHPKLLGGAANRLCIYDTDGTIYYSAVGIVDDLKKLMVLDISKISIMIPLTVYLLKII